jgi:hypothetical protein
VVEAHDESDTDATIATPKKIGIARLGPKWWYVNPPPTESGMSPKHAVSVETNRFELTYFM